MQDSFGALFQIERENVRVLVDDPIEGDLSTRLEVAGNSAFEWNRLKNNFLM